MTEKKEHFAFVLMPFSEEYKDTYALAIKAAAEEKGVVAQRVDEQKYSEGILERIHRQIEFADFIIADMSGENANVFYELGYAIAKDKLCITIVDEKTDIKFDLKHKRHIVYSSINNLKTELLGEIDWAIEMVETEKNRKIQANLKVVSTSLETTKHTAQGKIDFAIDLKPNAKGASPNIECAYLYAGKTWDYFQDGRKCPAQKSDDKGYNRQYLLTVPSRIGNWIQVNVRGEKELANAWIGDEILSSYQATGHVMLRLCTDKGNFDYVFNLDEKFEDIPF